MSSVNRINVQSRNGVTESKADLVAMESSGGNEIMFKLMKLVSFVREILILLMSTNRACSSVGRALRQKMRGPRFEPWQAHFDIFEIFALKIVT